ncbi:MAG: hypothetical protein PF630_03000 [Gammaproteobacteria bacterium]|jgi:hypothetical protein|nr:hypothetical protein [Gammaproteobacteria bacterium]
MKTHHIVLTIGLGLILTGCEYSKDKAASADCTGAVSPCDSVNPGNPDSPPQDIVVSKQQDKEFSLALQGGSRNTWLIVKCQTMGAPVATNCPTPIQDRKGKDVWAVKMNKDSLNSFAVSNNMPACSACLKTPNQCKAECSFPYMVIDLNEPSQVPVDPFIIVDR